MPRLRLTLGLLACLGVMAFSWWSSLRYTYTPGRQATPPARIGASSRPRLLVFLHPKCPCSLVTVAQLTDCLQGRNDGLETHVYVVCPPGAPEAFGRGTLLETAASLGQAAVDREAREALRFGAYTSGQVLLYDRTGRLQFSGGITDGRGHRGLNPGISRLLERLESSGPQPATAPVYGCQLTDDEQFCAPLRAP